MPPLKPTTLVSRKGSRFFVANIKGIYGYLYQDHPLFSKPIYAPIKKSDHPRRALYPEQDEVLSIKYLLPREYTSIEVILRIPYLDSRETTPFGARIMVIT
jgi:hypothetical protein